MPALKNPMPRVMPVFDQELVRARSNRERRRKERGRPVNRTNEPYEMPTEWRADAACVGELETMFAAASGPMAEQAKRVCAGCPVVEECLDYALKTRQDFGVWGGMDELDRRRLRRRGGRK